MIKFNICLIITVLMIANSVFATVGPAIIDGLPSKSAAVLETVLKKALQERLKITIQDLKVDYSSEQNSCVETKSEMHPDVTMGVCTLKFSAFQINGVAALIKTQTGYKISVIYTDLE